MSFNVTVNLSPHKKSHQNVHPTQLHLYLKVLELNNIDRDWNFG